MKPGSDIIKPLIEFQNADGEFPFGVVRGMSGCSPFLPFNPGNNLAIKLNKILHIDAHRITIIVYGTIIIYIFSDRINLIWREYGRKKASVDICHCNIAAYLFGLPGITGFSPEFI
jgi:hypothetical protein